MKSKEEIKESMMAYIKSDIAILGEQCEEKEGMSFINRIRGQIGMMSFTGMISTHEEKELYDELSKARKKAENKVANK